METKYFALFADGSNSDWLTFKEVLLIKYYLSIIKAEPINQHKTDAGWKNRPH